MVGEHGNCVRGGVSHGMGIHAALQSDWVSTCQLKGASLVARMSRLLAEVWYKAAGLREQRVRRTRFGILSWERNASALDSWDLGSINKDSALSWPSSTHTSQSSPS